jgi:hypothetical protein
MHTKFQTSPKSGGNSGSVSAAIAYFSKEDKDRDPTEIGYGFFTSEKTGVSAEDAKELIEHKLYSKSLGKNESKFFHVVISFSQHELEGKTDKELIEFAQQNFASMYLEAGKRDEIDTSQLAWCAKLETTRKYKGDDEKVRQKAKKSGQLKEGDQRHIHFVVARKTLDNRKISPLSNHFKEGQKKGNVTKGFDQDDFRLRLQYEFDDYFSHERKKEERYEDKLVVTRPDLQLKENGLSRLQSSQIDRSLEQLGKLLSSKAKKVRAFIDRSSADFKKHFIYLVKWYAQTKAKHSKALRPHLVPAAAPKVEQKPTIVDRSTPSLKPVDVSNNNVQPFNFLDELKKIELREQALTSKMGTLSAEQMSKEYLEIHEQRKRLLERREEEQKRAGQTKTPGQDPNPKKDRGPSI